MTETEMDPTRMQAMSNWTQNKQIFCCFVSVLQHVGFLNKTISGQSQLQNLTS